MVDGPSCRRIDTDRSVRGAALGSALENLGDTDGDGRDDIVIGTSGLDRGGAENAGAAWLVTSGTATAVDQLSGASFSGLPVSVDSC